jgi:hypothetical protein
MSLPTRKIGQHTVSALGYGAMSLGDAYGSAGSDEDRQKVRFCFMSSCRPLELRYSVQISGVPERDPGRVDLIQHL